MSNPVHRLFIAISLPKAQKEMLFHRSEDLAEHWSFKKWVHPSDYHLTLRFLGACTFHRAREVRQALKESSPGWQPFRLRIDGIGLFGVPTRPRILWAGVGGDLEALHRLYTDVARAVEPLGFEREKRPYRPHITLAKKYRFNDFPYQRMNGEFQPDFDQYEWMVEELVLFETHLYRSPMYQPMAVFQLGG